MSTFSDRGETVNITRATVVKEVAEMMNCYEKDIRQVYDCIEAVIEAHLMETTEDENVKIQLMTGVLIEGRFVPEHKKRYITNEIINVPDSIFVRLRLTKKFREKIIDRYRKELSLKRVLAKEEKEYGESN